MALVLPQPGWVKAVALHPGGKILATGDHQGILRLWDIETGRLTRQMPKLPKQIRSLVWQPGGKCLAIVSDDNLLRLQEPGSDKPRMTIPVPLTGHGEYAWRPIAFNPDGSKVLVGGRGPARVYYTESGQPTGLALNHGGFDAQAVAWSRDGKKLLTGSNIKLAQVWDAETGSRVGAPARTAATSVCVDFSPDGRRFLTAQGWGDSSIQVWDSSTGKQIGRTMTRVENNYSAVFSPDGSRIFASNFGNEAILWDVDSGERVGPPIWCGSSVHAVDYRADGQAVVTGSAGRACIWKVAPGMLRWKARLPGKDCTDIAFLPNGREVLAAPRGRFDRHTGKPLQPVYDSIPSTWLRTLAVNPAGQVYGGALDRVYFWEDGPEKPPRIIARMKAEQIALSPDGKRLLVSWPWGANACMLDAQTGKMIRPLDSASNVWGMYWSQDGKTALTARPGIFSLWDGLTGEPRGKPFSRGTHGISFAFHPDGHTVLAGTSDNLVRQWSTASWKEVGPRLPHQGGARRTAYSRDGRLIITNDAFAVRIWHPATGKPIGPKLRGDLPKVSPDNRDFALSHADGTIGLYWLPVRKEGEPEQVAAWVSGLTGQRLDERGGLIRIDPRLGGSETGSSR